MATVDITRQETDFWDVKLARSEKVLQELDRLCETSGTFLASPLRNPAGKLVLSRYILVGPRGGGDPVKIAVFAGIHGDERAGSHAIVETIGALLKNLELATGYQIFVYPVCNPSGFDQNSRFSFSGKDLNREFWRNSSEPEVGLLEKEIGTQNFAGLI